MTLTLTLERPGHKPVDFQVVHAEGDYELAMKMLARLVREEVRGEQSR